MSKKCKNIILVVISSVILYMLFLLTKDYGEYNVLFTKIAQILIFNAFGIMIIKNLVEEDIKINKVKTYFKLLILNLILTGITYGLVYLMVKMNLEIEKLAFLMISSLFVYAIKILLSFSVYPVVLGNAGIIPAIKDSIKTVCQKKNIVDVLLYNILFIVVIGIIELFINDEYYIVLAREFYKYMVLILNGKLYINLISSRENN